MSAEEILANALRLPVPERVRIVEGILSSLEESVDEVEASWLQELERRAQELVDGRVSTIEWERAKSEILREVENYCADRASS